MFESLRSLSDHKVLSDTDALAVEDRRLTLRLLTHLHEIERRKLHLKLGYSSMFVYCTSRLKLSEPAAARRLRTARCLARFSELHALLESGDVNLSTVSMVAKYLQPENAGEILGRIRGKSRREVEKIVAELEPRSVLPPDRVRMVVTPVRADAAELEAPRLEAPPVPATARAASLQLEVSPGPDPQAASPRCTVAGDSEKSPGEPEAMKGVRMEHRAVIQFSAGEDFMALVERIRSIASHRLPPNATFEQLFALVMKEYVKREDPVVRDERRRVKKSVNRPRKTPASPRQIPAPVRDQVFVRADSRCSYVSPGGKRCDATRHLQIDHVRPVALGGTAVIENLRLLCAHHNRSEAEMLMGQCEERR